MKDAISPMSSGEVTASSESANSRVPSRAFTPARNQWFRIHRGMHTRSSPFTGSSIAKASSGSDWAV